MSTHDLGITLKAAHQAIEDIKAITVAERMRADNLRRHVLDGYLAMEDDDNRPSGLTIREVLLLASDLCSKVLEQGPYDDGMALLERMIVLAKETE